MNSSFVWLLLFICFITSLISYGFTAFLGLIFWSQAVKFVTLISCPVSWTRNCTGITVIFHENPLIN